MLKKSLPIVIILLVAASFLAGSFYTRTTLNKKNQPQAQTDLSQGETAGTETELTNDPLSSQNLRVYAQNINLNLDQFESCLKDNKYGQRLTDDTNYALETGVNGSPNFFINGKLLAGAFPYELFKEIIDKEINGTGSTDIMDYSQDLQQAAAQGAFNPNPEKSPQINETTPLFGPQNNSVTIIEFTDPSCPFCTRATLTLDQLKKEYGDKITIAFYYFPGHGTGEEAAKAMFCASDQNKFWQYHDQVFKANAVSYGL